MDKETLFKRYKEVIDSLEVGKRITRQDVIQRLGLIHERGSHASIDNYRRLLEKACYIEYIASGLYQKSRNLEKDLTITKLKDINRRFEEGIGVSPSWTTKSAKDWEREKKWRKLWKESGLSVDEFIEKWAGGIAGEQFGI